MEKNVNYFGPVHQLIVKLGIFITFLILIGYCLIITKYNNKFTDSPKSENGVIDFLGHNPDFENGILLAGEWEFYFNKWLVDENTHTRLNINEKYDTLIKVPACWATVKDANGNYYPSEGYASYRTIIKNYHIDKETKLCLDIERISGAYRIYISNPDSSTYKLVAQNGNVTSNLSEISSKAEIHYLNLNPFELDGRDIEVIIEYASTQSAGLTAFPLLKYYQSHSDAQNFNAVFNFIIFGIIFGTTIFNFLRLILSKNYKLIVFVTTLLLSYLVQLILSPSIFSKLFYFNDSVNYEIFTIYRMYTTITICFLVLYLYFMLTKSVLPKYRIPISPLILYVIIIITTICLQANGLYYVAEPYYALLLISIFAYIIPTTIYTSHYTNPVSGIVIFFFVVLLLNSQLIDILSNSGLIYFDTSIMSSVFAAFGCATIYIYYIIHDRRREEENKELTLEIAQNNISILLSQIRPHFLYNTLNSINCLIEVDPKRAQKALLQFSTYLRGNMDSLVEKELIPFSLELQHIKNYVDIKLLRFEGRLEMIYDINATDFLIPPLCVQPLVENAIKHGVTKQIQGGTVWISTSEDSDNYYIVIKDNGIGFDENTPKNEKHKSIGLSNIKERLHKINKATLNIESTPNIGTIATITIPKLYEKGGSK